MIDGPGEGDILLANKGYDKCAENDLTAVKFAATRL